MSHLLPRAPVPTYVELPHLGRLPVRVLVRDARRGGAQGPHAEGSVNIGRGRHRDCWSSSSLTSGFLSVPLPTAGPPLETGYLKVGFNQERKCAWLSLVSLNRWTGHGGKSGLELSMKCRSSFHSIQRVPEVSPKSAYEWRIYHTVIRIWWVHAQLIGIPVHKVLLITN